MILQIFFLTLFTVSNCRPSGDTVDDCKGFSGMIWNGTHCICEPADKLVKFDEGSGASESVESDDSSDKSLFDKCLPGDDCDGSSPPDPIAKLVFDEGSGASESVDSDDSSDKSLFEKCLPGDDCDGSLPPDPIVKLVFDEGSGASESVDSDDSSDKSLFDKCLPGDDCDGSSPPDPIAKLVFDEGSGASESVDSDDSSDKSLFEKCLPGDDCDGSLPPVPRTGVKPSNTSCEPGDPSGHCCLNHISNNRIIINVFNSTDTNIVVFGSGLSSSCCSNEILNNTVTLNINSSFGTNFTLFDFKSCGSDKCCCSMKKSTDPK